MINFMHVKKREKNTAGLFGDLRIEMDSAKRSYKINEIFNYFLWFSVWNVMKKLNFQIFGLFQLIVKSKKVTEQIEIL